ncbi:MAG TPA: hypothetical protein VGI94_14445 [Reyranella sp.]
MAEGRFWLHRGEESFRRERQLLVDFLCASAGGQARERAQVLAFIDSTKCDVVD